MQTPESIEQALGDPARMEAAYREAKAEGRDVAFAHEIERLYEERPRDILLAAWAYRLGVAPGREVEVEAGREVEPLWLQRWPIAIFVSILLGFAFVVLGWGGNGGELPPFAQQSFLLGWAPATGLAILAFASLLQKDRGRVRVYALAAGLMIVLAALAIWSAYRPGFSLDAVGRTPSPQQILVWLHLPLASWAALAVGIVLGLQNPSGQLHAFAVKSVEVVVTAGLYLIAGVVFAGLAVGIFSVLGIEISAHWVSRLASWGLGAIPILAIATVYDPTLEPASQNWETGIARVMRTLTRLLLPLTLAVLTVYVVYFIPVYFGRAFTQRETLVVYNLSVDAIIFVLIAAGPGLEERFSERFARALKWLLLAIVVLTLLLNAYALAAVIGRTVASGLTPNRHAVIGWNVVTLLILGAVLLRQALLRGRDWADVFRRSLAQGLVLAAAWSWWVVVALPHI